MRAAGMLCPLLAALVAGGCGDNFSSGGPATDDAGADSAANDASTDTASMDGPAAGDTAMADSMPSCGNLAVDPANCGRCGHNCVGGACSAGVCQPVTLSASAAYPTSIVAYDRTGDRVEAYWAQQGSTGADALKHCVFGNASPCKPSALAGSTNPRGLIGSAAKLRWFDLQATQPNILSLDPACVAPCMPAAVTSTVAPVSGGAMAADGQNVYWTDDGPPGAGHLYGSPDTQANMPKVLVTNTASYPTAVAIDPGASTVDFVVGSEIDQCPLGLGLCVPVALVSLPGTMLPNAPSSLAVFKGTLYWTSPADNAIGACTAGSCKATLSVFARSLKTPWALHVDASGVYWTERGDTTGACHDGGAVAMCPLAGCPATGPTYFATGEACPSAIDVTASAVVWADSGSLTATDGMTRAVAKP